MATLRLSDVVWLEFWFCFVVYFFLFVLFWKCSFSRLYVNVLQSTGLQRMITVGVDILNMQYYRHGYGELSE